MLTPFSLNGLMPLKKIKLITSNENKKIKFKMSYKKSCFLENKTNRQCILSIQSEDPSIRLVQLIIDCAPLALDCV